MEDNPPINSPSKERQREEIAKQMAEYEKKRKVHLDPSETWDSVKERFAKENGRKPKMHQEWKSRQL